MIHSVLAHKNSGIVFFIRSVLLVYTMTEWDSKVIVVFLIDVAIYGAAWQRQMTRIEGAVYSVALDLAFHGLIVEELKLADLLLVVIFEDPNFLVKIAADRHNLLKLI